MATSVSKLLIRLTKNSFKTSKVVDATASFNARGTYYQDLSGWDYAVVQIETPSEAITFNTTNDDGSFTGDLLPAPVVPINWELVKGTDLATKTEITSIAVDGTVRFDTIGRFLQLNGATVAAPYSYGYLLSKGSSVLAIDACSSGIENGSKVVYAATNVQTDVTAFYSDSLLTMPVFGNGEFYSFRLLTTADKYTGAISPLGVVSGNAICGA